MSKRKGDAVGFEVDAPLQPGEAVQIGDTPNPAIPVEDRMAKARAAKQSRKPTNGTAPKKGADMLYVIVGETWAPPQKRIIGVKQTRGQCRKQYDAIKDFALGQFDDVYIVKGKRIEVDSL